MQNISNIGRYQIQGVLGQGSMGVVYSALDPMIGRSVALKVINLKAISDASEADFLQDRLFREAQSCGKLSHPAIVVVYDVGQQEALAFIAMELVNGASLQQRLAQGSRMPFGEALYVVRQIASALDYAHQNGVVHRDVKPGNVLIRPDGTVKVVDFGIAKVLSGRTSTVTGLVMGTPHYMSPEQIEGQQIDGRTDQFSLAVVAYEMLTGTKPFTGDSLPTLAHNLVYGPRPSAHAADSRIPVTVDAVMQQAFSKQPELRFASCSAFAEALVTAFHPPAPPPKPVKTGMIAGLVGGGLSLLALGGVGVWYVQRPKPVAAPVTVPVATPPEPPKPITPPTQSESHSAVIVTPPKPVVVVVPTQKLVASGIEALTRGDYGQAAKLFQKAADRNDPVALNNLGTLYETGRGVPQDVVKAKQLYLRAARLGNAQAIKKLARMK